MGSPGRGRVRLVSEEVEAKCGGRPVFGGSNHSGFSFHVLKSGVGEVERRGSRPGKGLGADGPGKMLALGEAGVQHLIYAQGDVNEPGP